MQSAQLYRHENPGVAALDQQRHRVVVLFDHAAQLFDTADGGAIDGEYHVTGLDTGTRGGALDRSTSNPDRMPLWLLSSEVSGRTPSPSFAPLVAAVFTSSALPGTPPSFAVSSRVLPSRQIFIFAASPGAAIATAADN